MPEDKIITVKITAAQMTNILAAYETLRERNPLYGFNDETRALIEHLQLTLAAQYHA